MCRNISTLICLILISNGLQQASRSRFTQFILDNKTYIILLPLIIAFSCALYSYELFENSIVNGISWTNQSIYWIVNTQFGNSETKRRLEIAATILRDCVNLVVLVILNILIIYRLRVSLRHKKKMVQSTTATRSVREESIQTAGNQQSARKGTNALKDIERKETIQTLMITLTCLNYVIGRLPLLYIFIKRNLFTDTSDFGIYAILVAYISYSLNFLFYYFSNYRFRGYINSNVKNILSCIKCNK